MKEPKVDIVAVVLCLGFKALSPGSRRDTVSVVKLSFPVSICSSTKKLHTFWINTKVI